MMLTTVLFDMGGTLEDIWANAESQSRAIEKLDAMLKRWDLDPAMPRDELNRRVNEGWARYVRYRDAWDVELKPDEIWCDYVLTDFGFPRDQLAPHCEALASAWEVNHFHRRLRPRVAEMLKGLKDMGLKLGVVSNTASLYQAFDNLERYGIRDFFQDVTLSSVTGFRKPRAEIFTLSLRQTQSRACESVYVGDTVSRDVVGSKRAGFAVSILIGSKLTREKDAGIPRTVEPDYVIDDIYEVYPLLQRIME